MSVKGALTLTFAVAAASLAGLAACSRQDHSIFVDGGSGLVAKDQVYVGRWAQTARECAGHPWVFDARRLRAGDGTNCEITRADVTPAGFSLPGICKRPLEALPGRLLVTFADANSVTLTGGFYKQPVTLVRCGAQR